MNEEVNDQKEKKNWKNAVRIAYGDAVIIIREAVSMEHIHFKRYQITCAYANLKWRDTITPRIP